MARYFNFSDEIVPARTNPSVEAAMVEKLVQKEDISQARAKLFVHDLVHAMGHYTVL